MFGSEDGREMCCVGEVFGEVVIFGNKCLDFFKSFVMGDCLLM